MTAAARPTVACMATSRGLWLAGCFKGYFVGRSVRDVEDILLSEREGGGGSRNNGRASWEKTSESEQGREMAKRKCRF